MFKDKVILITGGTGYLGRNLIRRILVENPHSIRVYSRDEVKHDKLSQLFNNDPRIRHFVGDVRDYDRLSRATEGADYVIHAAALKRLDLIEYNVEESVKTNILGTLNVVQACREHDVKKMVFVSTDKACSPVNTYGACKFVSERIVTESNYSRGSKDTVFTTVRYGNVLESTGSVIPFFESRIAGNMTIPLTDERMTRFIINSDEAVDLVFSAFRYSVGGEIFVPKLPAFNIMTLIEILKEKHASEVEIEYVGLRPGEKIHEAMINSSEVPRTYDYNELYVITSLIQSYQTLNNIPYIQQGSLLSEKDMQHYESYQEVRSKEEIKAILNKAGVL